MGAAGWRIMCVVLLLARHFLCCLSFFPFFLFSFLFVPLCVSGHGLTCLTHHISRQRIRAFIASEAALHSNAGSHLPAVKKQLHMLVITGAADILVHPSNSYHLSEQLQCPLYVLDHVGHMVHVEQPDVFAQLLHAHFARIPIQHLQAYTHAQKEKEQQAATAAAAAAVAPDGSFKSPQGSPALPATPQVEAMKSMTVTRLDDSGADTPTNPASPRRGSGLGDATLTAGERANLAARGAHSRRNSYLIQIDGETASPFLPRGDSSTSLRSSSPSPRGKVAHGWASPPSASAPSELPLLHRGLSSSSSSSSMSRRPSLIDLKQEREERYLRRKASCCVRAVARFTSLPLRTASSCVSLALALPKAAIDLALHPTKVLSIPAALFGAFKRKLGGSVHKSTPAAAGTAATLASASPALHGRTLRRDNSSSSNHSNASFELASPRPLARIITS